MTPRLHAVIGLAALGSGYATAVQAARNSPGVLKDGAFTPARPGAASYGPSPGLTCPAGGAYPLLVDELADVAKKGGKPQAKGEGRLCAVAETLLTLNQAEAAPESLKRLVSWHFGLPSAARRIVIATLATEDPRVIAERLVETVGTFAAGAVEPRFGLATERLRKDSTKVVLVMQDTEVELEPVPRRLASNGQAALSGRVLGDFTATKVLVSNAEGKLEATPSQPGKAFKAELRCGARPGRMQVEIRGEKGESSVSLARFPVACGTEPAASVAIAPPGKGPLDVAGQEQKLFQLMNEERASSGLPALAWDGAVGGVARALSESLRDEPKGGAAAPFDLGARLRQADVASPLVLQNSVAAPSAEEAQALTVTSPVNRSNSLSPEATHAGVGVALTAEQGGAQLLYATQLIVRQLPPVDAEAVRARLRAAVARRRADARTSPLESDAMLEKVAQGYAAELAATRGAPAKARLDELVAPLYKSYRTVNIMSGARAEPLDFAEEPGVVASGKVVGIGVARGSSPSLGKNTVFVVILVGARR